MFPQLIYVFMDYLECKLAQKSIKCKFLWKFVAVIIRWVMGRKG